MSNRRQFLKASLGAGIAAAGSGLPSASAQGAGGPLPEYEDLPSMGLQRVSPSPVIIRAIEVLRIDKHAVLRTTSEDGAVGYAITNDRDYLFPLMKQRVIPFFLGKDARELERLVDEVYRTHQSNYKLAGLAFWNTVGWIDVSIMDMLGRIAGEPISTLLGGARRTEIPLYVSSTTRATSPEEEVERLARGLERTGAKAVKFKVGGRMSRNRDASPGRSERLVPLARKVLGDDVTLYVDANGSYDVRKGIEIGRMLEDHGVAIFEEPVPFDEYENTKKVNEALTRLRLAGGEQDSSLARWRYSIIEPRALDIVQPDIMYNGGFVRTRLVALLADAAGLGCAPHNPKVGAEEAHLLQFAAAVPNLVGYQEYHVDSKPTRGWYSPEIVVRNGVVPVPTGPGLGIDIDPAAVRGAERIL